MTKQATCFNFARGCVALLLLSLCPPILGVAHHAEAQPIFITGDGQVFLAEDLNQDQDVLDPGEMVVFASGLPAGLGRIALDSAGTIFVSASSTGQVLRLSPDGGSQVFAVTPTGMVRGLAFDGTGDLFIVDRLSLLRARDLNGDGDALDAGETTPFVPSAFSNAHDAVHDSVNNRFFVANDKFFLSPSGGRDSIKLVSSTGAVTDFVAGIESPRGMALDSAGRLFAAVNPGGGGGGRGEVRVFEDRDGDGAATDPGEELVFAVGLNIPAGVLFLNDGSLLVSEDATKRIVRLFDGDSNGVIDPGEASLYGDLTPFGGSGFNPFLAAAELDGDGDGVGDGVDNCVSTPNAGQEDSDRDRVGNACDNCPATSNPDQNDADVDGFGDSCDGCPADPDKSGAGMCGCGVADVDSDGDGSPDCLDFCPDDRGQSTPGPCGCGGDADQDGLCECPSPDPCPQSDLSPTVVIDGCDSGATNVLSEPGCTISDRIARCVSEARDHRRFVRCVVKLTKVLRRDGAITGRDRRSILSCAAVADLP